MEIFVRIGYIILYIILFIFCLSILIVVHELGHLMAAKFFKVYCQEFSIGFGPALIHKKRKNGETYFSLRVVPFGGYVSMYGEGDTKIEGEENIPVERAIDHISKWKRVIILVAGVFNNAVLALVLFFVSEQCFVQTELFLDLIGVKTDSVASLANIQDKSYISLRQYKYQDGEKEVTTNYYVVDREASVNYNNTDKPVIALLSSNIVSYNTIGYNDNLKFFEKDDQGNAILAKEITATDLAVKSVTYNVTTGEEDYYQYKDSLWAQIPRTKISNPKVGEACILEEEGTLRLYIYDGNNWVRNTNPYYYSYNTPTNMNDYDIWCNPEAVKTVHAINLPVEVDASNNRKFKESGISFYKNEYWNDFGTAVKKTFTDWGSSATLIVRAFASLFTTPETWKDVGGIVAIGVQTSNVLQNLGVAKFIYVWGLISVNLAIVNLFPFPGLDGWQILVVAVEGIFRKEIPTKVKGLISFIGVALLLVFMVIILVKDVIGLF